MIEIQVSVKAFRSAAYKSAAEFLLFLNWIFEAAVL